MKSHPSTAKDVFLYLLTTITLAISTVGMLALLFQYINIGFPDPLEWYRDATDAARAAMAAVMVAWPTIIYLSGVINKELASKAEKKDMWVRKWLLYFTLFVASIAILIDLIVLIEGFLAGDLTTRIGLKVLSVLIVAIAVFWYYNWELKRDPKEKTKIPQWVGIGSSLFVVGWIIAGFFIIGTPAEQRAGRFDEERVFDLQDIQYAIDSHFEEYETLPESLDDISGRGYFGANDPKTNEPYMYKKGEENTYELCAAFETTQAGEGINNRIPSKEDWSHPEGYYCFERTAEKILLK